MVGNFRVFNFRCFGRPRILKKSRYFLAVGHSYSVLRFLDALTEDIPEISS